MASVTPGSISVAAQTFIDKHTEVDLAISPLDECPICLEAYTSTSQQSIRIRGIKGCSHVLCLNCLKEILCNNPQQGKKCPLCRTQWLAPASREGDLFSIIRASEQSHNRLHTAQNVEREAQNSAASLRPRLADGAATIASANTHFPPPTPRNTIAEETTDDEGYRTQLNDYNNFRRDVQNIRTRASGRQPFSRSSRPRDTSSRLSNSIRESGQFGKSSTATVRSRENRSRSFWGLGRAESSRQRPEETQTRSSSHRETTRRAIAPPVPDPSTPSISPEHGSSLNSQQGFLTTPISHNRISSRASEEELSLNAFSSNSPSTTGHNRLVRDQQHMEIRQNMHGVPVGTAPVFRSDPSNESGTIAGEVSSDSSEQPHTSTGATKTTRSRTPHPRSPNQEGEERNIPSHLRIRPHSTDVHNQDAHLAKRTKTLHERERLLDARQTHLSTTESALRTLEQSICHREQTLTAHEREVSSREEKLAEREHSLLARAQRIEVQQQRLERAMSVITRHGEEAREMMGRQQEEFVRAWGEGEMLQ